jgi:hypothetical protein
MPRQNAESIYKKLVENPKCPQHQRISALRFLTNPPLALLRRLVNDPNCPGRLSAIAADKYVEIIALKQIARLGDENVNLVAAPTESRTPAHAEDEDE